jgi:hypothetical protein
LHRQADFDRMRTQVNANAQPWKGSYDLLVASPQAQLSWTPRATATVIRGGTGDNVSLLYNDVQAAYQHALLWKITGNTSHGNKARDILNAWSSTHTTLTGNADRYLASGLFGYQFANAAEMMRGYSGFDVTRFRTYLLNVYYIPLVERFLYGNSQGADHNDACITNYWANWDLANMAAAIAIGVFADDRAIFDKAINYFKTGAGNSRGGGNGVITKAIPFLHSGGLAQWQESGRDQGHTILGVGLMGSFCEIAWNQGQDMYGYSNNRFMQAAQYVARYNNGGSVPFTTYNWGSGTNCAANTHTVISSAGRGEDRPIWEMIYNHYAIRRGLSVPDIAAAAAELRPEGGPGGHATTFDQPGFGSLTYTLTSSGGGSLTYYQLRNRGTGLLLDGMARTANGDVCGQYANTTTSTNAHWEMIATGSYYYLQNRGTGLRLDGMGRTANGSDAGQWANTTTSTNAQWAVQQYSGEYYRIQNRATGLYLDGMGRTANGSACGQYAGNTSVNQQWQLVTISSSSSARMGDPEELSSDMEAEENADVFVHPNPTVSEVAITLPASYKDGEKIVDLLDQSGRTHVSEKFNGITHTIDVGNLPRGMYVLKVRSNKKLIIKKVIKK